MKIAADYLRDLLDRIARIEQIAEAGEATFVDSFVHQDAIIRNYEVIGEIVKRLPDALLQHAPQVNWAQVKGFRDFLAHNYDQIETQVVWSAVKRLPELKAAVETILAALAKGEEDTGHD